MTHPAEDRLQDYIDDLLCREERAELEQHLVQCSECTAVVRAERELRAALRSLPRSIEPPAHVLADIHAQLDARVRTRDAPVRWRDRPITALAAPLAAAALLLVLATALFTWYLQSSESPAALAGDRAGAGVVRQVLATERPYVDAAAELEAVLAEAGDQLTPATRELVQHNLRVIDRALAESRAALEREPDNVVLAELLRAAHEQKLTLLRGAARATGGT